MSNLTKWIVGIIIVIVVVWIGYGLSNKEPISTEPIKIGVIGHFSGEYASYGVPMKNAVQLAVEEINSNGGINKRQIELIIEDDGTVADKAASAMNKLVSIDDVDYVISAQGSSVTAAIVPIAQNNKCILMITLGSAPGLTNAGDYIFRSVPSDIYQGIKIADFINEKLGANKIAGLYINDAYGVGIRDLVKDKVSGSLGIQEMFEDGTVDFRSQLLKIKNDGADTLILVSKKGTPIILKQIKELGLGNLKIIASETVKDDQILKQSGSAADGIFVAFIAEPKDYIDFISNYKIKFNEDPSAYSKYAYDGMVALSRVIKNGGNDLEKVKSNLLKVSFNGASGNFAFDGQRERIGMEYIIYKVENGQFVPYEND